MSRAYTRRVTETDKAQARREYNNRYRHSHPEKIKEVSRRYYERNREKRQAYQAAYRMDHRDEINAKRRERYRAETMAAIKACFDARSNVMDR